MKLLFFPTDENEALKFDDFLESSTWYGTYNDEVSCFEFEETEDCIADLEYYLKIDVGQLGINGHFETE